MSRTVRSLNDKISTLERKLEVATEMMESSIVPSKLKSDNKWDRLASTGRENDGVRELKWEKSKKKRSKSKKKKRKVLGMLQ